MKLSVAVLLLTIGVACATIINDAGQPGCKTPNEMSTINYRNIWDPTAYWKCEQSGVAASLQRCPDGEAWLDSQKKCVEWDQWDWEEAVAPPSRP